METIIVAVITGLVCGGLGWFIATNIQRSQSSKEIKELDEKNKLNEGRLVELEKWQSENKPEILRLNNELKEESIARARAETSQSETEKKLEEQTELLKQAKTELADTFKALASETLSQSTKDFLTLADQRLGKLMEEAKGDLGKSQQAIGELVKPIAESLGKFDEHVRGLEDKRTKAYTSIEERLKGLFESQKELQKETGTLVNALRTPQVRGKWGELTLIRVVELAGMSEYCDFSEQESVKTEEGPRKPDLIVNLPNSRRIVVDAKVSLSAYIDATEATSEEKRIDFQKQHAAQVRQHMVSLGRKRYWDQFKDAPEFVVMFIPGESFLADAAHADHSLIEDGMEKKVIVATPTTLIALLKAIAYGWKQEQVTKNAQEINALGKELHDRIRVFVEHLSSLGRALSSATKAYNSAVSSFDSRVMPGARKFDEFGASSSKAIPEIQSVDKLPNELRTESMNSERGEGN